MTEQRPGIARPAIAVILFAVAMGYVEAAVVVDLRAALGLAAAPTFPLQQAGPAERLALIEVGREFATLVMLAALGAAIARRRWEWLAWTAIAFGVWDIAYYGWLNIFIGWPSSLFDVDLLFLIPVPWVGPVWAPIAVSVALITVGLLVVRRYAIGPEPLIRGRDVAAGLAGGAIVLLSFTFDARNIIDGGLPGWFPWPLFAAGILIAAAGAADVLRRPATDANALIAESGLPNARPGASRGS